MEPLWKDPSYSRLAARRKREAYWAEMKRQILPLAHGRTLKEIAAILNGRKVQTLSAFMDYRKSVKNRWTAVSVYVILKRLGQPHVPPPEKQGRPRLKRIPIPSVAERLADAGLHRGESEQTISDVERVRREREYTGLYEGADQRK